MIGKASSLTFASSLALASLICLSLTTAQAEAKQTLLSEVEPSSQGTAVQEKELYKVRTEHGKRLAQSGKEREYSLYVPQAHDNLPVGPYPMVVLIHGFMMTGAQQSTNAQNLAERGFVVFAPNMTRMLLGDSTRMENVHDVIDHIQWLTGKNSPLPGLVDAKKIAVGGNSSGGAVILEVALEAQRMNVPIAGLLDLDGTIWERTFDRVPSMKPLKILSLRCEPSLCNEHARQLEHLKQLSFPIDDVKVIGSHHCDVENPTTLRCRCACGASHEDKYRKAFAELMYAWLRDNFGNPSPADTIPQFSELVRDMQDEHKVVAQLNRPVSTWLASSIEGAPNEPQYAEKELDSGVP